MRTYGIGVLLVVVVAGYAAGALAQTAAKTASAEAEKAGATQYKIGVVDMQFVVAEYDKRKQRYQELQAEVDRLQTEIDRMSTEIEKAKKDFEDRRATMSAEERLDLKNKIDADYVVYRSELERRQRLIDNQEEQVLIEVIKDVEAVLTQLAAEEHYHLILNGKAGPRGAVLYHSPTIDITSKVLALLNKGGK